MKESMRIKMIRLKKILAGSAALLLLTGCGKSDIKDTTAELTTAKKDSSQRKLFEWIQSAEGKALIDLEGYVISDGHR